MCVCVFLNSLAAKTNLFAWRLLPVSGIVISDSVPLRARFVCTGLYETEAHSAQVPFYDWLYGLFAAYLERRKPLPAGILEIMML